MTRITMYAAAATLFAAAPAYGGDTPSGRDDGAEAATARQEVKDVAQDGVAVRQVSSRHESGRRATTGDRSGDRGARGAQKSTDRDERGSDDYFRQQQIWTAP